MKTLRFLNVSQLTGLIAILAISGCVVPGMGPHDRDLGYNGSFEVIESGLPVNWTISRYPIKAGEVEATIDTVDAISGDRSLRIAVLKYASTK